MTTKAVQASQVRMSSQIKFTDHDTSYVLLVVGVGVLTYEIVSKAVHQLASERLASARVVSFAVSAIVIITASKMELPRLQGQFVFVCLIYVAVSIWTRKPSKAIETSSLPDYMFDMVAEAKRGTYLSKIGYENAVKKVEICMNKKTKPNALLLAVPGAGKSTIPETIAYKIANAQYPPRSIFCNAKLIRVSFTGIMGGTKYRGELEDRIKEMVKLAKADRSIIYFVDETHMLVGGGQTHESRVDISQMLLDELARGDLRILGASTIQDYKRCIEPIMGFDRRFEKVLMHEPVPSQCFQWLQHSYRQVSAQGRIKISNEAIAAAILFSKDIKRKYFPDKAIDLIDGAIASVELTDETENPFNLTEQHIAEFMCLNSQTFNAAALVQYYRQFIAQNPDYFPGLADIGAAVHE